MSRAALWVLVVLSVQTALFAVYWFVEQQRDENDDAALLGTQPPQPVNIPMRSLPVVRRDGTRSELSPSSDSPTLVHVWATWCPPCREELPGLLAMGTKHKVEVVAVALDQNWNDVDRFLGSLDSSKVVLAASEDVEQFFGVRSLPVTFLLEPRGQLILRFDGARDWTDKVFVRNYIEEPQ